MSEINIPILGDDGIWDLVNAFLLELHEKKFLHISNGTQGIIITNNICKLFYDAMICKELTRVPTPMEVLKSQDTWYDNQQTNKPADYSEKEGD